MKKIAVIVIFVVLSLTGCQKSDDEIKKSYPVATFSYMYKFGYQHSENMHSNKDVIGDIVYIDRLCSYDPSMVMTETEASMFESNPKYKDLFKVFCYEGIMEHAQNRKHQDEESFVVKSLHDFENKTMKPNLPTFNK